MVKTVDKICGIYCIENIINNKKYIGQSVDIERRFKEHRGYLRNHRHNNAHLQYAWDFYKEENFKFYVVEECNKDDLDVREKYYIATMNTMDSDFGYNIEPGGFLSRNISEETKQKISNSLKGRVFSDEHRQKIGEANRRRVISDEMRKRMSENHADFSGERHPNYGKHHSEETRRKMSANSHVPNGKDHPNYGKHFSEETRKKLSEAKKGKFDGPNHPRCRPVYCPELDRTFWGPKEAEIEFGIDASYISACLSGKQKSAGKHPVTGEKLHWFDADNTSNKTK